MHPHVYSRGLMWRSHGAAVSVTVRGSRSISVQRIFTVSNQNVLLAVFGLEFHIDF